MAKSRNPFNIVRLSITLLYVEPRVARRMDVRSDTNLEDLHLYIQAAMGWENCHLWGFEARRHGQRANWSIDEYSEELDATLVDVINFLQGKPEFTYTYDYGDSWEHNIRIGKIQPARDDRSYPYLVSGTGRCPLEDIGGAWGYADFLRAFEDPDSEYREYYPGYFNGEETWDPEDAELDEKRRRLAGFSE
ncbi:MAG: plasmid pRiA4b ORF-3 family protein [Rhodospirillaceae bacterium]|nr:plasmid pRiA4b ORF-3 family protein [Rhodospirillaceae bacterium]